MTHAQQVPSSTDPQNYAQLQVTHFLGNYSLLTQSIVETSEASFEIKLNFDHLYILCLCDIFRNILKTVKLFKFKKVIRRLLETLAKKITISNCKTDFIVFMPINLKFTTAFSVLYTCIILLFVFYTCQSLL